MFLHISDYIRAIGPVDPHYTISLQSSNLHTLPHNIIDKVIQAIAIHFGNHSSDDLWLLVIAQLKSEFTEVLQSPLFHHLLGSPGKVPTGNDIANPTSYPPVSQDPKVYLPTGNDITVPTCRSKISPDSKVSPTPAVPQLSVLKSTKLSAVTPWNSVSLGAAETAFYVDIISQLKSEFAGVFCDKLGDVANFPSVMKTKSGVRFKIILKPNATPRHAAPYQVPKTLLPCFREMIFEHLNVGCLCYSSSPWASPTFLVKKPNSQHHLVCDFHTLNNQTMPDMYPMGNIQDILHHAAQCSIPWCLSWEIVHSFDDDTRV